MVAGTAWGIFALSPRKKTKSAESTNQARAEGSRIDATMIDQGPARLSNLLEDETSLDEARLRQQAIGVRLRQMFDQVVNEPVPDEFLEILRRADQRTAARKC